MRLTQTLFAWMFTLSAAAASAQPVPAPALPLPVPPIDIKIAPSPTLDITIAPLPALDLHHVVADAVSTATAHVAVDHVVHEKLFALAGQANPFKEPAIWVGQEATQAEAWYSQARSFIDRDQYDRALSPLNRVIDAKTDRADAATYWKAYSLWKLARRDEALTTIGQLQKQFPESRWIRDARALELELKQASGQTVSADAADDDLKLLALQGIMRTNLEAALPVVEQMLAGGSSVRVKERALFVLSQNRSDKARQIVAGVARGNSNPDLQQRAIRYLGMSASPDAVATLTSVYKADSSMDTRRTVISALASTHNATAVSALVALARAERNGELKTLMVRHLSNSRAPEAQQYMLELLK